MCAGITSSAGTVDILTASGAITVSVPGIQNPTALFPSFNGCGRPCSRRSSDDVQSLMHDVHPHPAALMHCRHDGPPLKSLLCTGCPSTQGNARRRYIYVTQFYKSNIVAIDVATGSIAPTAAATLTEPPGGARPQNALSLCGTGRHLYASAWPPATTACGGQICSSVDWGGGGGSARL